MVPAIPKLRTSIIGITADIITAQESDIISHMRLMEKSFNLNVIPLSAWYSRIYFPTNLFEINF